MDDRACAEVLATGWIPSEAHGHTARTAYLVTRLMHLGLEEDHGWAYTGHPLLGHLADAHWPGLREPVGSNSYARDLDHAAWMYVVQRHGTSGSRWLLSVREADDEMLLGEGAVARVGRVCGPGWDECSFSAPFTAHEAALELCSCIGNE